MASHTAQTMMHGPPYLAKVAMPGLVPTPSEDVAVSSVYLALYTISAILHQLIFQYDRLRGQKFPMSYGMFGFGMARIITLGLRIAWAYRPDDAKIAITAAIFTNLGIVILYVIAILLSLRMFRALQPHLGWNGVLDKLIKVAYALMVILVALIISWLVVSVYERNRELLTAAIWIERAVLLYLLLFTLIAPTLFLLAVLLPASPNAENFGSGSMEAKKIVLGVVLFFTVFIAGFRMGTIWAPARPLSDPHWFDKRPAFYVIELGFEIFVTYFLILTRFDNQFWIPNKSSKPGDYSSISLEEARREHKMKKEGGRQLHTSASDDTGSEKDKCDV